jgi:nicotinic acid mononucleotide adenylyltransferase
MELTDWSAAAPKNLRSINVIASEAKQSSFLWTAAKLDCFVARAPLRKRFAFVAGNDERWSARTS